MKKKFLSPRILINATSGIGMNVLYLPMLRALKKEFTHSYLCLAVRFQAAKDLYECCPYVDEIKVINRQNFSPIFKILKLIYFLRRQKFEVCINPLPANNPLKNLFAYLSGAPLRIAHCYKFNSIFKLNFLINNHIEIDCQIHDIEQNLNLLKSLNCSINKADKRLELWLSKDDYDFVDKFLRNEKLAGFTLVGIHPGSSVEFGMGNKRWGKHKFAQLADELVVKYQVKILIFGGDEEKSLKNEVARLMKEKAFVIEGLPIRQVAVTIKRCTLFISNDTALMHLAVAAGTKTIGIFGPTDFRRTAPFGDKHLLVRKDISCSPCWSLENLGRTFKCKYSKSICLEQLDVNVVMEAAEDMLSNLK